MNKTISVWLILEDGKDKGKIVLQRRSADEKSFPFVFQATWSGSVEPRENVISAVKRECKEEIGDEFYSKFDFSKLKFLAKQNFFRKSTGNVWECHHYIGQINAENLKLAKLQKGAFPEFIFADEKSEIYPIESGKNPKNNIALFDDQYKILSKILNAN